MQKKVRLTQGDDNSPVEACVVPLATKHIEDFENIWKEQLRLFKQEDKFWDLILKLRFISRFKNYEGYAIEYNDKTEGLLIIETQEHGSRQTPGKRLVYINGVASAPWNREVIQRPPKFKGVGTALLRFARSRSVELGYEGRVGLHSLPGTERFYENQGMFDLGPDEDYDDLIYFEFGLWRQGI